MTGPTGAADATVAAVQEQAVPLGLAWQVKLGTVNDGTDPAAIKVQMDGDQSSVLVNATSLVGTPVTGSRVAILDCGDGGLYVIGLLGGGASRELTNFVLARASTQQSLGATPTLVPGCDINLTVIGTARYEAVCIVDFDETVAGTTVGIGALYIDGSEHATGARALFEMTTVNDRSTVGQQWDGVLTPGAHTFELRVSRNAAAGTQFAQAPHTCLSVKTYN